MNELNSRFEKSGPEEILRWAYDKARSPLRLRVALATSFQSQGVVLIDMLMNVRRNPDPDQAPTDAIPIFTLDTGRLNQETYDVMDRIRSAYDTRIEILFPNKNEVERMVNDHGINLFYKGRQNRILCCEVRKVKPLNRYLVGLDAWITSIRRDQTENRTSAMKFEMDELHGGILKINPIVDWSSEQIWDYVRKNKVPYNKLHDLGYPSIGCAPCTRAVEPGQDPRSGRWWWEKEANKECGLHFAHDK